MGKKKITKQLKEKMTKNRPPRAGFEGLLFYEICGEASNCVKEKRTELDNLYKKAKNGDRLRRLGPEGMELLDNIPKQESIAIAFAAMCLESCIWDYAACYTSQKKAEEKFGSLNLVAKWQVIPEIINGSDITKVKVGDTCLLGMLRKLKQERNNLAHPRSTEWSDDWQKFKEQLFPKPNIMAEDAFILIKLLLKELEKVDKTRWWFFETAAYKYSIKGE